MKKTTCNRATPPSGDPKSKDGEKRNASRGMARKKPEKAPNLERKVQPLVHVRHLQSISKPRQ
mgnify:CR=1 FL=1